MTLQQAKTHFIANAHKVSVLMVGRIGGYLSSCTDDNFNLDMYVALMKSEGVKIDKE